MEDSNLSLMIKDCLKRESKLTEWEQEFISNCYNKLENGKYLTPKQINIIDLIWERIT